MNASVYALVAQEKQYPLQIGKNVVGRSSVPVDGVSFINLESPQAAISRMQAFLDIAANGDAWISDCNSTNGCQIVFGDVPCTFEALEHTPRTPEHVPGTVSTVTAAAGQPPRKTEHLSVIGASSDSITKPMALAKPEHVAGTHRGDVPYLDDSSGVSPEHATSARPTPAPPTERRGTKRCVVPRTPSTSPPKKAKTEAVTSATASGATTRSSSPKHSVTTPSPCRGSATKAATDAVTEGAPPHVCVTGMDSDERTAISKRVRQLKGRVMEDITKANLLVVATPPVRTPKFIIAVARGIPIVPVAYICNDTAELADPRKSIVGLKTEQHTYSAAALEKVIYRKDRQPLLHGVPVNVSALSSKTKSVATEIIVSSGGKVVRAKSGGGLAVTDDQLDTLYDSILRGKVPTSL